MRQQPPGKFRGLTVYLQLQIAGDVMPLGVDRHRKPCQPTAIFKPPSIPSFFSPRQVMHALNGTFPFLSSSGGNSLGATCMSAGFPFEGL